MIHLQSWPFGVRYCLIGLWSLTDTCPAAPIPKFEGLSIPTAPPAPAASSSFSPPPPGSIQPQMSGGPIRVPPLTPAKALEYSSLFEKSGAQNGILSGQYHDTIYKRLFAHDIQARM